MHKEEFEWAFSQYIDGPEYDAAQTALFEVIRNAFEAGFCAAERLCSPQDSGKVVEIRRGEIAQK
ncbi:MAG: hypothetical protein ACOX6U_01200 [Oscillospiraceae bacterium]|jgi:hypothetical protein